MLQYIKVGQGPENVLVFHGWKMDHTCFDAMHSSLDPDTYTYIFIDQRGYGLSRDLGGEFSIVQIAADAVELADNLSLNRFHIIGHSMGGKVISRLMADIPERIKSAYGVTPCPPVEIPFDDEGWKLFRKAATDASCREAIFSMSTGDRLSKTWYSAVTKQSMASSTAKAFADYLESWVGYDFPKDVQGCNIPVKIGAGEFDPHLTYDLMKETWGNFFTNVEVVELKNCGHYPMYEIPLTLAADWQAFMAQHISE